MAKWEDATSYRRGERGKVDPSTFQLLLTKMDICVTRHIDMPGTWVLRCPGIGIDLWDLQTDDLEEAKCKALVEVESHLATCLDEVRDVLFSPQTVEAMDKLPAKSIPPMDDSPDVIMKEADNPGPSKEEEEPIRSTQRREFSKLQKMWDREKDYAECLDTIRFSVNSSAGLMDGIHFHKSLVKLVELLRQDSEDLNKRIAALESASVSSDIIGPGYGGTNRSKD